MERTDIHINTPLTFDFQKGDVVEFCGERYYVIGNNGSTGVVCPFGETYYVRNFYWKYQDEITTLVRKPDPGELESLGLKVTHIQ